MRSQAAAQFHRSAFLVIENCTVYSLGPKQRISEDEQNTDANGMVHILRTKVGDEHLS
jgi:hypothetical protein